MGERLLLLSHTNPSPIRAARKMRRLRASSPQAVLTGSQTLKAATTCVSQLPLGSLSPVLVSLAWTWFPVLRKEDWNSRREILHRNVNMPLPASTGASELQIRSQYIWSKDLAGPSSPGEYVREASWVSRGGAEVPQIGTFVQECHLVAERAQVGFGPGRL